MNYVLSDECRRATGVVRSVCNDVDGYGATYGISAYPDAPKHPIRDIIDIYAFTSRTLIVADDHEVFRAVYRVIESFSDVPKIDEYTAFDMTRQVVNGLRKYSNEQSFSAFTHHAKLGAVFNGSSTFGTVED